MNADAQPTLLGHPRGLFVLFFTEMWERFSYYGMRAILVLYIIVQVEDGPLGGLGWTKASALALYGWYTMSVYVASIPGGLIADRLLGQRRTVMVGGLTLCAGHFILAFHGVIFFYIGLTLIVIGVGLLKPNISTMVGGLYKQGDPRRDLGFQIFYMGINIGALGSGLIVGYVGEKIGWHYGFALAGFGMLLGQAVYIWGKKYINNVGNEVVGQDASGASTGRGTLSKEERERVIVLLISFLIVIVFWGAFEQAGGLMNIFTKERVDLTLVGFTIPASWFQSLNPAFIIIFATLVGSYWMKRQLAGKESSTLLKMGIGTMIMGSGFLFLTIASLQAESSGKAWIIWIVLAYLFHTIGELCASPTALSFITKLTPVKYASLMMGVYFAMSGFGNKLAGLLGETAVSGAGELTVFTGIAIFCIAFGGVIIAVLKPLKRLTHGAEDLTAEKA